MNLLKKDQSLKERLITNAVEKYMLTDIEINPFSDPEVPQIVSRVSYDLKIDQDEIIEIFKNYKVYGMEMVKSNDKYFIRLTL